MIIECVLGKNQFPFSPFLFLVGSAIVLSNVLFRFVFWCDVFVLWPYFAVFFGILRVFLVSQPNPSHGILCVYGMRV